MISVGSLVAKSLVYEVPNKSAAHIIVFLEVIHIFLEVAEAVFHCVRIFA